MSTVGASAIGRFARPYQASEQFSRISTLYASQGGFGSKGTKPRASEHDAACCQSCEQHQSKASVAFLKCFEKGWEQNTSTCSYTRRCVCCRMKSAAQGFGLHEEVGIYLAEDEGLGELFKDCSCIIKLAYLCDMCRQLNHLNFSMQGVESNVVLSGDKARDFCRELQGWLSGVGRDDILHLSC